jgi:hypothetical protein
MKDKAILQIRISKNEGPELATEGFENDIEVLMILSQAAKFMEQKMVESFRQSSKILHPFPKGN